MNRVAEELRVYVRDQAHDRVMVQGWILAMNQVWDKTAVEIQGQINDQLLDQVLTELWEHPL